MTVAEATATVRVVDVTKIFDSSRGRHEALAAVSLDIHDGEFLTILGPSGCGKTTLLRILAGFESPTRGRVVLDGLDITHVPPNRRPMGMVFQNYALFPHLSVFENVAYGLKVGKVGRREVRERVEVALSVMDLAGLEDRLPANLSGGQQQRVALARSIVVRPRVLLFDEPLSNLDARLRDQMRWELRRIQQQLGVTSVYVTHDQSEAMAMSDRIVVMSNGHIEQVDTPQAIYRTPTSLFVADFIGRANVLPCVVVDAANGTVDVLGTHLRTSTPLPEGPLAAVVRPEDVAVFDADSTSSGVPTADAAEVRGVLRATEYLGGETHLRVELDDGRLVVAVSHHRADDGPERLPAVGAQVVARFAAHAVRPVVAPDDP